MKAPSGFWQQVLSPPTARFILALLSLIFADLAFVLILKWGISAEDEQIVTFALGQLFALPFMAFGYYFGSTARGDHGPVDAHIVNRPGDPVPVEEAQ